MGDISAEPSMEEILSSIKRIIAEEEGAPAGRRRAPRIAAPALEPEADDGDEVLELSEPMPAPRVEPRAEPEPTPMPKPRPTASAPVSDPAPVAEPIVSREAADATRGALDVLSRLLVKPEPGNDGTLEGLVREMLRPMLREWLDAHLPDMVEAMVAKEIARISGQGR
jgi:uncharacterized protein